MALQSLAGLQEILRGRSAPGVANPLEPEFIAAAEAARDEFRAELATSTNEDILTRLYGRPPMAITPDLMQKIAEDLRRVHNCPEAEIILVGSAQFGFSMSEKAARPERPARGARLLRAAEAAKPRYRLFAPTSDLDIAIIDKGLWERAWKSTYAASMSTQAWRNERPFADYFFKGWVRPDMLPDDIDLKTEWFVENRRLKAKHLGGQHTINAGLYYDRDFLHGYAVVAIDECRALEI